MARIKREQASSGLALIHAKTEIANACGSASASKHRDMLRFTGAPMGDYLKPLDDNWSLGLGLHVPFGLATDYERNFQGRYHGERAILSLGAAWSPNGAVPLDLAYSYLMEDDAHIETDDYRASYNRPRPGRTRDIPLLIQPTVWVTLARRSQQ